MLSKQYLSTRPQHSLKVASLPKCKDCSNCIVYWDKQNSKRLYLCKMFMTRDAPFLSIDQAREEYKCGPQGKLYMKRNHLSTLIFYKDIVCTMKQIRFLCSIALLFMVLLYTYHFVIFFILIWIM